MDECKPLPRMHSAARAGVATSTSGGAPANSRSTPDAHPLAGSQGLTLVHVRAQLEHIRDTFMG